MGFANFDSKSFQLWLTKNPQPKPTSFKNGAQTEITAQPWVLLALCDKELPQSHPSPCSPVLHPTFSLWATPSTKKTTKREHFGLCHLQICSIAEDKGLLSCFPVKYFHFSAILLPSITHLNILLMGRVPGRKTCSKDGSSSNKKGGCGTFLHALRYVFRLQ